MSQGPQRVVILGASNKPDRISYLLLQRLQNRGYELFPVHPVLESIQGIRVYPTLKDLPSNCHVLTVYLNAIRSQQIAEQILSSSIPRIIFNPGAENPPLEAALREQGKTVEEACSLVLHSQGLL